MSLGFPQIYPPMEESMGVCRYTPHRQSEEVKIDE